MLQQSFWKPMSRILHDKKAEEQRYAPPMVSP